MILEQLMPALSPTMESGTIANWLVNEGDTVSTGQVLAEVQTDKTVVEWEALDEGVVAAIVIPAGEVAQVNAVALLLTDKAGEDIGDAVAEAKAKNDALNAGPAEKPAGEEAPVGTEPGAAPAAGAPIAAAPIPAAAPIAMAAPTAAAAPAAASAPAAAPSKLSAGDVKISPVAARIAAQRGLNIKGVKGSGDGGRIVKKDIEALVAKGGKAAGGAFQRPVYTDSHQDVGLSPMRQVIASRLLQSKQQIPHFYVTETVNVSKLFDLRTQLNQVDGVKLTFNDLITKACALTLVNHPTVNSTFDGATHRKWHQADISIAVALPDGLITPIVPAAERLSLPQLSATIRGLVKKAQAGTLAPEEYQGGSFSISNLGMFGIDTFQAIVNPPQAAILAVGGIKDVPVVEGGEVVPGKVMKLTLSCDHRVVDGADAAGFLKDLREVLEAPGSILL